jgi:hypothetical protein
MGEPPSIATQLGDSRAAAESSVCFFDNVEPLALRLGITDLPASVDCRARLLESEDVNTDRLRADGLIVQRVQCTASAEVDVQSSQESVLNTCWPTGAGAVARTSLGNTHLPRATTDLVALGDIGAGMVVAADAIDAARLAKFSCVSAISPDTVLGVPISLWLAPKPAITLPVVELRAAIATTVALFTTAITICDKTIDAILTALCDAMTSVDTSDYAREDCSTECAPEPAGEDTTADTTVCPEQTTTPTAPGVHTSEMGPGSTVASRGGSSIAPAVAAPQSEPTAAVAPTVAAAAGTTTVAPATGSGTTPSVTAVDNLAAMLGQVATAFGQGFAGALTAVVETTQAVSGSPMVAEPTSLYAGLFDSIAGSGSQPGEHASIRVGDKVIDIEAGDDSMTLTVHAPGGGDTQVFAISADGTIEEMKPKGADTQQESAGSTDCDTGEVTETSAETTDNTIHDRVPTPHVTDEPSADELSTDEPITGKTGPPDAATAPECPVPVPPVRYVPGETIDGDAPAGTPVAPQSSEPGEPMPPDGGMLALAGEQ